MKKSILFVLAVALICHISEARQPRRGYRGFLEWDSSLRTEKFGYPDIDGNIFMRRENTFYTGFSTSHGYQINQIFFVGVGFGMERCDKANNWIAPVFFQGRADLQFGKFTPFGDIRLGVNLGQGAGVYFSPAVGYRFNWGRKIGVNLGVGLTLAGYKVEHYDGVMVTPDCFVIQYLGSSRRVRPYFSFRLGIDF